MKNEKKGLVPRLRFPEFRDLGEWNDDLVKDLVTTVTPPKKLTSDQYEHEGMFPVVDQSQEYICGWTNDEHALVSVESPLIVFGDHTCALKIVDQPFVQGADGIKILKSKNEIEPGFLYQYLLFSPVKMESYKRHFSTLKEKSVVYPDKKTGEQQKIADCLSSLDALIAAQADKIDALKTHKKGLMQQLFPREGETVPRLRFPEFRDAGEWRREKFGKLVKINSGKGFKASEYSSEGARLLQIENVGYGAVKWRDNAIYLPDDYIHKYPELVLTEGDIVLALNRPVTNGELKIALLGKTDSPSILYQRVGKMEFLSDTICKEFVFQLCFVFVKDFVVKKSIGSDQPFISIAALYAQSIMVPKPEEQKKVADCLSSLDALITANVEKLDALKAHKKGLMQQLFPRSEAVGV